MIRHLLHTRPDRWTTTEQIGHIHVQLCTLCPRTRVRIFNDQQQEPAE